MEEQRDSAIRRAEASDLNTSIDASLSKSGMEDPVKRANFVAAKKSDFKLSDKGELVVVDPSGEPLKSKANIGAFMDETEYLNNSKVNEKFWWTTGQGGEGGKTGAGGGGEGEGGKEGGEDEGPKIITDRTEWQKARGTKEGLEKIGKGQIVYRPASAYGTAAAA